jgi:ribonuclease HI
MIVFTDGSAFSADGLSSDNKAGAGVFITDNRVETKQRHYYSSYSLGEGSSLFAELLALLRALQILVHRAQTPAGIPNTVYIFIDSLVAINNSLGRWKPTTHLDVIDTTKPCLSDLRRLTDVYIQWVPGHAGVVGNEIADFLAKRGAKGTSSTACPPDSFLLPLRTPSSPMPPLQLADDLPPPVAVDSVNSSATTRTSAPPIYPSSTLLRRSTRKRPAPTLKAMLFPGINYSQYDLKKRQRHTPPRSHSVTLSLSEQQANPEDINLPPGEIDDLEMLDDLDKLCLSEPDDLPDTFLF